jgi:hypothetical protein
VALTVAPGAGSGEVISWRLFAIFTSLHEGDHIVPVQHGLAPAQPHALAAGLVGIDELNSAITILVKI